MQTYGFAWPQMLSCDKYPSDDMCIKPVNQQPGRSLSYIILDTVLAVCFHYPFPCSFSSPVPSHLSASLPSLHSPYSISLCRLPLICQLCMSQFSFSVLSYDESPSFLLLLPRFVFSSLPLFLPFLPFS